MPLRSLFYDEDSDFLIDFKASIELGGSHRNAGAALLANWAHSSKASQGKPF